jgi:hypothetical protein
MRAIQLCGSGFVQSAARVVVRLAVVAALLMTGTAIASAFDPIKARADVGDLGAPPSDAEIQQALTDFYNAGHPPDATVDVQFAGPALVGKATMHPNPPPQPWCVRCGYPDQGSSLMYPVLALASVTVTQGLASSALPASSFVHVTDTTYDGTPCPADPRAQYCPTYYFYRDGAGHWQIA